MNESWYNCLTFPQLLPKGLFSSESPSGMLHHVCSGCLLKPFLALTFSRAFLGRPWSREEDCHVSCEVSPRDLFDSGYDCREKDQQGNGFEKTVVFTNMGFITVVKPGHLTEVVFARSLLSRAELLISSLPHWTSGEQSLGTAHTEGGRC